jgi:transcription initiation factor TFIID subunit 6
VEDVNLALSLNGIQEIYGLSPPSALGSSSSGASVSSNNVVNLSEFSKQPIPKCPLLPELSLHWLAVDGFQPLIPENPSAATTVIHASVVGDPNDAADQPLSLPKEIQHFYYRTTGLILACDHAALPVVLDSLRNDMGLQELVPYFSKFIYQQIRASTRSLPLLRALICTVSALISNKSLRIEFHLQQLLPAIFTCIVATRLSSSSAGDHWSLRSAAAQVIVQICRKYSELFPDFQARFCKTYVDALTLSLTAVVKGKDKEKDSEKQLSSLATMYGGLVGLTALGHSAVRSLILPRTQKLLERLNLAVGTSGNGKTSGNIMKNQNLKDRENAAEKCRSAILHALGAYMVSRMKLSPPIMLVEKKLNSGIRGPGSISRKRPRSVLTPSNNEMQTGPGIDGQEKVIVRPEVEEPESPVCGFEEALVPYYASASRDLYYCRLFI